MDEEAKELREIYARFSPWLEARRSGALRAGRFFDCCLRSAVSKLFDFNTAITSLAANDKVIPSFFVAGTLRGSCEDLIILDFLRSISNKTRDPLLIAWASHEIETSILNQTPFFEKHRPFQPILKSKDPSSIQPSLTAIQAIWDSLGFKLKPKAIAPSTWTLASKAGLKEVYDFFYRFSCDFVHFNPVVLLRFGWGDDPAKPRFSASNFDVYYRRFGLIYGAYLWNLFIQLLKPNLRLTEEAKMAQSDLTKWLRMNERWPEITTHEELGKPDPKQSVFEPLHRIYLAETQNKLFRRRRQ